MEREKIILRTYGKIWNHEKKIYSIDNIKLLVPINPSELLYFAVGLAIAALLSNIPIFAAIPVMVRYLLLPFGLMKFLTKKKLDGKMPHHFLIGYLRYLMQPREISRFQPGEKYKKGKFTSVVTFRQNEIVDVTEEMINRKGEKKKHVRFSDKIFRR